MGLIVILWFWLTNDLDSDMMKHHDLRIQQPLERSHKRKVYYIIYGLVDGIEKILKLLSSDIIIKKYTVIHVTNLSITPAATIVSICDFCRRGDFGTFLKYLIMIWTGTKFFRLGWTVWISKCWMHWKKRAQVHNFIRYYNF